MKNKNEQKDTDNYQELISYISELISIKENINIVHKKLKSINTTKTKKCLKIIKTQLINLMSYYSN